MLKQHEEMKETCKAKETHQNQNNSIIDLTNKLETFRNPNCQCQDFMQSELLKNVFP